MRVGLCRFYQSLPNITQSRSRPVYNDCHLQDKRVSFQVNREIFLLLAG